MKCFACKKELVDDAEKAIGSCTGCWEETLLLTLLKGMRAPNGHKRTEDSDENEPK